MDNAHIGLNYWWKRFNGLKEILKKYMFDNEIGTVEEAIHGLLDNVKSKQ